MVGIYGEDELAKTAQNFHEFPSLNVPSIYLQIMLFAKNKFIGFAETISKERQGILDSSIMMLIFLKVHPFG